MELRLFIVALFFRMERSGRAGNARLAQPQTIDQAYDPLNRHGLMGRLQRAASAAHRTLEQLGGGGAGIKNDPPVKWSASLRKAGPEVKNILRRFSALQFLEETDQKSFQSNLVQEYLRLTMDIKHLYKMPLKSHDKANLKEVSEFLGQKAQLFKYLQHQDIGGLIEANQAELAKLASDVAPQT